MKTSRKIFCAPLLILLLLAGTARAQEVRSPSGSTPGPGWNLRVLGRELAADNWSQDGEQDPAGDSVAKEKLKKVAEGLPSLLMPGWSQWRQGNRTRAALLAGAEVGVWTSWLIFHVQGGRREDSYKEYAVNFAGVNGADHPEDYWKAVAIYIDSDDYNENRRLDIRAGGELDGPAYENALAWQWSSPSALEEYRRLRTSSLGAFDRAENVLALMLLTRALAFIDAVRTGLLADDDEPGGSSMGLHLDSQSLDGEPAAELGLRLSF